MSRRVIRILLAALSELPGAVRKLVDWRDYPLKGEEGSIVSRATSSVHAWTVPVSNGRMGEKERWGKPRGGGSRQRSLERPTLEFDEQGDPLFARRRLSVKTTELLSLLFATQVAGDADTPQGALLHDALGMKEETMKTKLEQHAAKHAELARLDGEADRHV